MKAILAGLKTTVTGVDDFFKALGRTLKELADSKKAVLGALAVIVPALSALLPQYAATLDKVTPFAEAVFLLLITAYGVIDAFNARQGGAG